MKQVFNKKSKVTLEEVPMPVCGDNHILVKTHYSAISIGTELDSIRAMNQPLYKTAIQRKDLVKKALYKAKKEGYLKTFKFAQQMISNWWQLGYSCAGEVIETGKNVSKFSPGDLVACAGQDIANHAEYINVPINLAVKVPKNVSLDQASFTTIGSIAIQGIRRLNPTFGETIAVVGLGLIGQITAKILKSIGCEVIGIDLSKRRVNMSKSDLGLTSISTQKILSYTKNIGVDGVLITAATKSSQVINSSMAICRKKARVVVVGKVGMEIDRKMMYEKELDLLISTSYGPGRYDPEYEEKGHDYPLPYVRWTENRNMQEFITLLSKNSIDLSNIIEKEYPIEEAETVYKSLASSKQNPMGVVFYYNKESKEKTDKISLGEVKPIEKKINIALIGAGNFVKSVRIPDIKKIKDFNIMAVVTKFPGESKQVAKKVKANYCTCDYKKVLSDKGIDAVLIGTRHDTHAQITIDALNKRKHVFCEKPMCLTRQESKEILKALNKNKGLVYSVGFNRTYSPITQKLKQYLKSRTEPLIITYRVNSKPTSKSDWVNDPKEGGGRVFSDMVHMFSYMNYITDSKPARIKIERLNDSTDRYIGKNNISLMIKYEDGSIGTLVYTDVGNEFFSKERIEVFCQENVYVIDDFEKFTLNKRVRKFKQDKGHYQELIEFKNKLQGKPSKLLDINHIIDAMEICFQIIEDINK